MSSQTLNLTPALYQYLQEVSLREHPVLKKLRDETSKLPTFNMQISPEQGQFMGLLVELIQAKKTLDIGTYTGYSALAVAFALPDDGKVITCDISADFTDIAKKFWTKANMIHKIDLQLAPALSTLQTLLDQGEGGTFDLAFIDADKNHYLDYYEKSLMLLRQGGLIAIDNVLWGGDVICPEVQDASTRAIRALNQYVFKDERVSISMLSIGDGLTLARKR